MYGTNIPGKSDNDFMGVFMPTESHLLGLNNIEQVEFSTKSSSVRAKNTKDDVDCTLYSLPKFVKLLLNNNPNTLESLFIPENCRLYVHPIMKKLLDSRDVFVSKKLYHSFRGYSHSQMERLKRGEKNESGRQELIQQFGYDTKMGSHVLRLYLECNELLSTGTVTLPLKENQMVLTVKKGEWEKEKFLEECTRLEELCDELYTKTELKHSPDHKKADVMLQDMIKEFYGYESPKKYVSGAYVVRQTIKRFFHRLGDRFDY
jgi:predicted nucleotidyltransferase